MLVTRQARAEWREGLSAEKRDLYDAERLEIERMFVELAPTRRIYVSIYSVSLEFGGREEGGWYYDRLLLERSESCANTTDAVNAAKARAKEFVEANRPQHEYTSVLGGFKWSVIVETSKGSHQTVGRPRYE